MVPVIYCQDVWRKSLAEESGGRVWRKVFIPAGSGNGVSFNTQVMF